MYTFINTHYKRRSFWSIYDRIKEIMQKVEVYISTAEPDSSQVKRLSNIFRSKLFELNVIIIPNSSVVLSSKFDLESYRLFEILKKSSDNCYTIFLKDNSITNVDKNGINLIVNSILGQTDWDLCYLSFWLDRCDLYGRNGFEPIKIPKLNSEIVKTSSPNGIQALMFSPHGKKVVLGVEKMKNGHFFIPRSSASNSFREQIEKGAINALAVLPTIFSFDVLQSNSVSDLAKLSVCRRPIANLDSSSIPGVTPIFWFIVLVVIIILILYSMYYLSRKK